MTIEERFAKYSVEELKAGIERLNARIDEHKAAMDAFKAEGNIEFFRMTESQYNDDVARLMDAQCALEDRLKVRQA